MQGYFFGRCGATQEVAERVGFEPTWGCLGPNPLSRRARYDHFGTSPARDCILPAAAEEIPEQLGTLLGQDAVRDREAMVQAGGAPPAQQRSRSDLGIGGAVDQAADAGVDHRPEAHQAGL